MHTFWLNLRPWQQRERRTSCDIWYRRSTVVSGLSDVTPSDRCNRSGKPIDERVAQHDHDGITVFFSVGPMTHNKWRLMREQLKKKQSSWMDWIKGKLIRLSSRPNPKLWLCFTSRAVLAHPLCVIANCYCCTKWPPINPVSPALQLNQTWEARVWERKCGDSKTWPGPTPKGPQYCLCECVCGYNFVSTYGKEVYCYGLFYWDSSKADSVFFSNWPITARSAVFRVSMLWINR